MSATLFARPSSSSAGPGPSSETTAAASCMGGIHMAGGELSSSACVEDDEEKHRCQMRESVATGSSTLQVAILLQMPTPQPRPRPLSSHTVTEVRNDIGVRGEVVIGLVEAPWTSEHPPAREGEENTTS